MFGNIVTDGRGPIHGPGSPSTESRSYLYTASISSLGGSYGGSGGESVDCSGTYFSLTANQVVSKHLTINSLIYSSLFVDW